MKCTKEEVLQYVEEEDVRFIRLAFCDVFGKLKNIAILPSELKRAFEEGFAIDASAIDGFEKGIRTDLFLKPDPFTLSELPWRSQNGRVVRMYCNIVYPDGTPFECDSREILERAVKKAEERGITFEFGSFMEFYLFKTDENGNRTDIPYDHAAYMDVAPEDKGENVRREICLALEQMGILPESSHHEEGPGQNEIDFRNADPLNTADNTVTFKTVVSSLAYGNGLYADFSPKPLKEKPGSGFHVHFSVKSTDGKNMLPSVIAGLLEKIGDMTLFLNPTKDSYQRLGGYKAPGFISWSKGNRSQLIRVAWDYPESCEAELRSPDPSANPYLVFALIIYAGLYGIENELACPEHLNPDSAENASDGTEGVSERSEGFRKLPTFRREAVSLAEDSEFIRAALPKPVIDSYLSEK